MRCPVLEGSTTEGDLIGAGMTFTDGQARGFPLVQIGGTTLIMTPDGVPNIFQFFPDAPVRIGWGKKGPLLTTTIRDRNGNLVAYVKDNHWKVYPFYSADKNYTKDSLEIEDNAGH